MKNALLNFVTDNVIIHLNILNSFMETMISGKARYSAFDEEYKFVSCLPRFQQIRDNPRKKQKPLVDPC